MAHAGGAPHPQRARAPVMVEAPRGLNAKRPHPTLSQVSLSRGGRAVARPRRAASGRPWDRLPLRQCSREAAVAAWAIAVLLSDRSPRLRRAVVGGARPPIWLGLSLLASGTALSW